MSDANNTIDVIDERFIHQRIKAPGVICQEIVQVVGDLTVPAPWGVTMDKTGQLNHPISLTLNGEPQVRAITIIRGKVIIQGVVPVTLLVDTQVAYQLLEIPFQTTIECPESSPGDVTQLHDVQLEGFSIAPVQLLEANRCTLGLHLSLKVVLEFCVIVVKEKILKINAAEVFC